MYAIQKHINSLFAPYTKPSFGALKPALVRLEDKKCLTTRKMMSDGGKLSVFYSITSVGKDELKRLLVQNLSDNPLQFLANARVKISCADVLEYEDKKRMFFDIKSLALSFKVEAQNILNDEYNKNTFYQKIMLDNIVCELSNFIAIVEGLEKDNASNS